uniref:Ig-like domain-containing protein n=1 Tax=Tetraodon nigroviridis TaxID=99883 RepID=H3BXV7_TETNG
MAASLVILILIWGTVCTAQLVTFENPDICALKGSSVYFRCFYNCSEDETVTDVAWYKGGQKDAQWIHFKLADVPLLHNRSEYLGDMRHDCSLAIHDVQQNDSGHYYFHFDTDAFGRRSKTSVYLSVTEMEASVRPSPTVRPGWAVWLECQTSCPNPVTWFKDGEPVTSTEFQAQIEDAGNYICAIEGEESVQSDPVTLDVQYPPLNVHVEVSYTGSLTWGNSVSLSCSSAANPAAENYTWYRGDDSPSSMVPVGSGQVFSITSLEPSHLGWYLCKSQNLLGENSSMQMLNVDSSAHLLVLGVGVKVLLILLLSVAII